MVEPEFESKSSGSDVFIPLKNLFCLLKKRFHLFTFKEMGREGEIKEEKHRYVRDTSTGCLSHAPNWGPGPQPRHVP